MPPAINTHSHIFTLLRALLGSTSLLQGQECAASFFSASPRCAFVRSLKAPRILEATHIPGFDPINKSHQPIRSRIVPVSGVSHLGRATKMSSHENSEDLSKVEVYDFGPYKIHASEVFLATKHSFAFVNLKPVVPDVLVSPKRAVPRFSDLVPEEVCDMWLTANRIGEKLEAYFKASSLTFAIQDGPAAGQTVPHVHIHILPRSTGDFEKNDDIYDVIDDKEKDLAEHLNLDQERVNRTFEEMASEASALRALFSD